ncbi:MAG: hypothetical protein ACLFPQ_06585 [Candidatus Woesearchaeota archaeon]
MLFAKRQKRKFNRSNDDVYASFPSRMSSENDEFAVNNNFSEFKDHIKINITVPSSYASSRYEFANDNELLRLCLEHEDAYEKPKKANQTVMLTHPFYLQLTHKDCLLGQFVKQESDDYVQKLIEFLEMERDPEKTGIVVLDTVHHYAASSSLLLEKGLLDRVIFTQYNRGDPLYENQLMDFSSDDLYFGGAYNRKCLTASIKRTREKAKPENIFAIRDLIVNSPEENSFCIVPNEIEAVDESNVISLEEAVQKLNLG